MMFITHFCDYLCAKLIVHLREYNIGSIQERMHSSQYFLYKESSQTTLIFLVNFYLKHINCKIVLRIV
jgi:hypothetical protein